MDFVDLIHSNSLRVPAFLLAIVFIACGITNVTHGLTPLTDNDLRSVTGQEGLKMTLNDFQISGDHTFTLKENTSGDQLYLENMTLDDPNPSNGNDPDGTDGSGVTTGTTSDPITFDIEGSDNGRWVIELPGNTANMEKNDIVFSDVYLQTGSTSGRRHLFNEFSITNAQYAGGTRFALGSIPGGGLNVGIAIVLDGDITALAPATDSGLDIQGVGGAQNCNNGPTGFNASTDCSGALNWASLDAGRPLQVEMFNNGSRGLVSIELNPNNVSPTAGQLVVENMHFDDNGEGTQNESFGEIWTESIAIRDLQGRFPTNGVSSNIQGSGNTR